MRKTNTKKALSIFILAAMIISLLQMGIIPVSAATASSGTCGDGLTWTLGSAGYLTISGNGDMYDYDYTYQGGNQFTNAPWGTEVRTVTINAGVTNIGDNAFFGCTKITSVIIPDSVVSIGSWSFKNCTGITDITIPTNVTSVGVSSFSGCTNLTSVIIPKSVVVIDNSAFSGCTKLKNITIPDSVTSIGESAFYNTGYYNTSSNWENDLLYIGSWLVASKKASGSHSIKEGTVGIAGSVFSNCTSLTGVTMPDGLVYIGNSAFYYCDGLTSITIPDSVTNIGDMAFYRCDCLTSILIPDSVTTIGDMAFEYCTGITSVTIPASVIKMGNNPFGRCRGLTTIDVDSDNTIFRSVNNCIIDLVAKTLVVGCKNSVIPDDGSVTRIGTNAFYGCTGITSVAIPDCITSIDSSAFYNCIGLTSITIPDSVTVLGNSAFMYCTGLASITITNSVTSIGNNAFYGCTSLESIRIPDSVTSIGNNAFCYTKNSTSQPLNVILDVYKNSYAHNYALANGLRFSFIQPIRIDLLNLPHKLAYLEAKDELDITDGAITAYYDNGTSEEIAMTVDMISGFNSTVVGSQTLTVTYEGQTATFEVEIIAKSLIGLEITQLPYKTTYLESKGDNIEIVGGIVTLYYNNDTVERKNITADMVSGFDITKVGKQVVIVTCGEFTDTFEVEVLPKSLTGIAVTTLPNKTAYLEAKEALDIAGGKLTLYYDNDTSEAIDLAPYMVSGFDNTKVGVQALAVSYQGFDTTFDVEVIAKELTGIAIASQPTKRTYLEAKETLDVSGGRLMLLFNNDTVETIDLEADMVQGFDNKNVGKQTLTVAYGGFADEYDVEIIAKSLTGIAVSVLPYKTSYLEVKEELDVNGGKLKLSYDNDTSEVIGITADMVSGFDNVKVGAQTLTVSYGGFADTFEVMIVARSLTGIAVTKLPDKVSYLEAKDELDIEGGVLTFYYDNDTSRDAYMTYADGYKVMFADNGDFAAIGVSGFNNATPGVCSVKVVYERFSTYFEVTITEKEIVGISVVSAPNKLEYEKGDRLDVTGCRISVTYNNDAVRSAYLVYIAKMYRIVFDDTSASEQVTVSGFDSSVAGKQTVTIAYREFSDTFEVKVNGETVKGDADGDGEISVADALIALRIAAKLIASVESDYYYTCDVDADDEITVADALLILRVAAKLADSL